MVKHTLMGWLIGFVGVALLLGSMVTFLVWRLLHRFFKRTCLKKGWEIPSDETEIIPLQPFLIGFLERVFFGLLVAFWLPGVASGILGWVAIKMAAGWNRVSGGKTVHRMLAFTGLLSSLTSMLFAVLGGLIANGSIPLYKLFQ